jgi:hypothetical protein
MVQHDRAVRTIATICFQIEKRMNNWCHAELFSASPLNSSINSYLVSCYFLFLEKKKVTKVNSRQTRMLRRFAVPAHNNHNALAVLMHFI